MMGIVNANERKWENQRLEQKRRAEELEVKKAQEYKQDTEWVNENYPEYLRLLRQYAENVDNWPLYNLVEFEVTINEFEANLLKKIVNIKDIIPNYREIIESLAESDVERTVYLIDAVYETISTHLNEPDIHYLIPKLNRFENTHLTDNYWLLELAEQKILGILDSNSTTNTLSPFQEAYIFLTCNFGMHWRRFYSEIHNRITLDKDFTKRYYTVIESEGYDYETFIRVKDRVQRNFSNLSKIQRDELARAVLVYGRKINDRDSYKTNWLTSITSPDNQLYLKEGQDRDMFSNHYKELQYFKERPNYFVVLFLLDNEYNAYSYIDYLNESVPYYQALLAHTDLFSPFIYHDGAFPPDISIVLEKLKASMDRDKEQYKQSIVRRTELFRHCRSIPCTAGDDSSGSVDNIAKLSYLTTQGTFAFLNEVHFVLDYRELRGLTVLNGAMNWGKGKWTKQYRPYRLR